MAFKKVDTQVDFPAQERAILEYWRKTNAFEQLRAKNRGKPKWSFLDGPITANNPMGVHHAWGRTYKDVYQRYFAMTGHEERYQNGFDCQGLWVEVEVEKELGLKSKRDIEDLVPGDPFASIDKFVQLCKQRVDKYAKVQTEQSIRLGYWMDWDREEDWVKPHDDRRSYFTMSEENNYTIWSFLKRCHERGLIYRGYDAMPWCPRCSVGLSQMEMAEGYRLVSHRAVFVRFPLRGRPGENLLVWTTTPWTLTSNVAAAVNPDLTYLRVRHKGEVYYVAKGAFTADRLEEEFRRKEWVEGVPKLKTLEQIFKEKGGYEIVSEIKGAEMIDWSYDGPFDELEAQNQPGGYPRETAEVVIKQRWAPSEPGKALHRVIEWHAVGETEGTGIVHIAPGCGKEDFQLGKEQQLPPIAPLDEYGVFLPGFGPLAGMSAVDPATANAVFDSLRQKGLLLAIEEYPHNYPHCWRCKTELLFRLVDEWFINMSWREEIMDVVRQATFLPKEINGQARELDWLKNMGDWMISKKRFWGLALPIWVCEDCGHFEVIGGRTELKERVVEGWGQFEGHSPHRPWIDLVKIKCSRCGGRSSRILDVGNPWLDAGIVPYSTIKYNSDRDYWEKWFPADFITESFPGQFRNWFYAILAMSTIMTARTPMKVLLGHGQVRDQKGEEMHKSLGNAIPFDGATDSGYKLFHERDPKLKPEAQAHRDLPEGWVEGSVTEESILLENRPELVVSAMYPPMGADEIRWLYSRHNPANNINFGPGPAEELRSKFLLKLWNTYAFFCNYARIDGFDPNAPQVPVKDRTDIDRWILSDLQLLVEKARTAFESFDVMAFCLEAEKFVDDKLSNWYVRRNRRRFWKSEKGADKLAAYQTLYAVLTTLVKLFAPVMPFLAETMYQNLSPRMAKRGLGSVHLCDYPEVDQSLTDEQLSADMDALLRLVSLGFAARNMVKIKVRQPLAEIAVRPGNASEASAARRFEGQLCDELNVKKLTLHETNGEPLLVPEVKPNLKTLGPKFQQRMKEILAAIAAANPADLAAKVQAGQGFEVGGFTLEPTDLFVQMKAPEGWAGVADRGTEVVVDARITEDLAGEGMARDVVRQVQQLRKDAGLEMEDRIALVLKSNSAALLQAIATHKGYIAGETLTVDWPTSLDGEAATANVKIDGQPLTVFLQKVKAGQPSPAPTPPGHKVGRPAKPKKARSPRKPARSRTPPGGKKFPNRSPKVKAKARTAQRKRAKAAPALTAHKDSKPARAAKKPARPKSASKGKAKTAAPANKKARKPNKKKSRPRGRR
jgi:isoleucyl-tRNA synthetase